MLPAGMSTAEKNSLCLYVLVFQYVMKMSRFFAYRCSVHAAAHLGNEKRKRPEIAHLRKVMRKDRENAHLRKVEEDGEVGQGRAVERVSRGG